MKQENYNYIKEISRIILLFYNWVNPNVADFIGSQSALETAYGRSTIAIENNNLFGMKYPHLRIHTAIGENREHAKYLTPSDSILDYFYWCSYNKMTKLDFMNLEQFKTSTNWQKYCPNTSYLEKIEMIYKSYQKQKAYGEQQETRDSKRSEENK